MKKFYALFLLVGLISFGGVKEVAASTIETDKNPPSHALFDNLLQKYVTDAGKVDYKGIQNNVSLLDDYLTEVKKCAPESSWSEAEKLTYWMNVYNAFTIKLIVDNYPVSSIKDLHGGKPWDVKWIKIGEESLSLNDIEHGIIRKEFDEPRIHFAVNCAAKSCPPLWNHAYNPESVYKELEARTKLFFSNTSYNTISTTNASVSKILDWYGEDFGDVAKYISQYSEFNGAGTVTFKDYDWGLNKQ